LLQAFTLTLTLAASTPIFLFLSVLFPEAKVFLIVFWMFTLVFDLRATYVFYLRTPSQFGKGEQNKMFAFLVGNLGFKKASIAFTILVEVPIIFLFALLLLQTVYVYLFDKAVADLSDCLAAGFGMTALGHFQAALRNFATAKMKVASN